MNNVNMPQAPHSPIQAAAVGAAGHPTTPAGDGFALLLMQLLGGQSTLSPDALMGLIDTEGTPDALANLSALPTHWLLPDGAFAQVEGPQPRDWLPLPDGRKESGDDTDEHAMAMMAQLLAGAQAELFNPIRTDAAATDTNSSGALAHPPIRSINLAESTHAQSILQASPQEVPPPDSTEAPDFRRQLADVGEKLHTAWVTESDSPAEHTHPLRFGQALRRLNMEPRPTEDIQPADIEALQARADAQRLRPAMDRLQAESPLPQPHALTDQLKTGILENLDKREAFVVKLRPEGLGEITLKLAEEKGKVVVRIGTSSPQLTRLISQEAAALQTALKPLEAEIGEIVTLPDSQTLSAGGQFAFTGQQTGAGRQFSPFNTPDSPAYYPVDPVEVEREPTQAARVTGALDSYI